MNLYTNEAESRLRSALYSYEKIQDGIGMCFYLSKLHSRSGGNDPKAIALNILRDQFKGAIGDIYIMSNGDAIVIYRGKNQKLIDECLYNMQYLFTEEEKQLSFVDSISGVYTKIFYSEDWEVFLKLCRSLCETMEERASSYGMKFKGSMLGLFGSMIEDVLLQAHFEELITMLSVYKASNDNQFSQILDEIWIDIKKLSDAVGASFDILSNPNLRAYLKEFLDFKILIKLVSLLKQNRDSQAYLLNLSISTIASTEFWHMAQTLSESVRKRIIIAISISDVFIDFGSFLDLRQQLVDYGFKLCLDNLDYLSFMQIDRASLGFDLVRIDHDVMSNVITLSELEQQFIDKVNISGSSRVIVQVPDKSVASTIRRLGIVLFQVSQS